MLYTKSLFKKKQRQGNSDQFTVEMRVRMEIMKTVVLTGVIQKIKKQLSAGAVMISSSSCTRVFRLLY